MFTRTIRTGNAYYGMPKLVGWIGTAVIVAVQVAIAVWIVYIKIRAPD